MQRYTAAFPMIISNRKQPRTGEKINTMRCIYITENSVITNNVQLIDASTGVKPENHATRKKEARHTKKSIYNSISVNSPEG